MQCGNAMQAPVTKTDAAGPPIEDLKLGQLIVKTRKGRLFRGTYQRSPAAIKVCAITFDLPQLDWLMAWPNVLNQSIN